MSPTAERIVVGRVEGPIKKENTPEAKITVGLKDFRERRENILSRARTRSSLNLQWVGYLVDYGCFPDQAAHLVVAESPKCQKLFAIAGDFDIFPLRRWLTEDFEDCPDCDSWLVEWAGQDGPKFEYVPEETLALGKIQQKTAEYVKGRSGWYLLRGELVLPGLRGGAFGEFVNQESGRNLSNLAAGLTDLARLGDDIEMHPRERALLLDLLNLGISSE